MELRDPENFTTDSEFVENKLRAHLHVDYGFIVRWAATLDLVRSCSLKESTKHWIPWFSFDSIRYEKCLRLA